MDKWIEFGSKNGWALLGLIFVAYVFYKKIWPLIEETWKKAWALIEKRLADADAREKEHQQVMKDQGESFLRALKEQREADDRRWEENGKLFAEALRTQNVFASETHKESMKSQSRIADKLDILDQRLQNGTGR